MRRLLVAALLLSGPAAGQEAALPGAPKPKPVGSPGEASRGAPVNGVLVLYGNERCPTDTNGNEIVVCTYRPAAEQFRVPKELRELEVTPENQSWAVRSQGSLEAGAGGIGSCTTVGVGGATGCFVQRVRDSRRENAAREEEQRRQPQ